MKFKLSLLLMTGCLIICATTQITAQTLTINTESSDSEVYIDNKKVGTGKKVETAVNKSKRLVQIKVERSGYKTEYAVAGSSDKIITIANKRKPATKEYGYNAVGVQDINIWKGAEEFKTMAINLFEFNSDTRYSIYTYYDCPHPTTLGGIKIELEKSILNGLALTGYIDTSSSLLNSGSRRYLLDLSVADYTMAYMIDRKTDCKDPSIYVKLSFIFKFQDKFDKLKYKEIIEGSSGVFLMSGLNWQTSSDEKKAELLSMVIQDAVQNCLLDVLSDSSAFNLENDDEPLAASKLPSVEITPKVHVTDMKSALNATVTIVTKEGFGTGCVISNDGDIVTSYHVVAAAEKNEVQVILNTGDTLVGKIIRTSKFADLALIKTEHRFPFAFKVDAQPKYEVTDEVFAIGTPASIELSQTISRGILSAIRKEPNGLTLIQTDVSVNPGNSGGPLIKKPAIFIGVVNSKISGNRIEGLGFCTPSSDIMKQLNIVFK
ncbi:MAG: trypsin-like peptidase domain-containing protein [Bacteroidetes bacterium]|nr:trypsin-like peptidase domain-containing protein [Bacteroidota bacterium]